MFAQNCGKMAEGASGSGSVDNTKRLEPKKQSLDDAYAAPANLLEIEVADPENHGFGRQRYTDYEIRMRVRSRECGSHSHDLHMLFIDCIAVDPLNM